MAANPTMDAISRGGSTANQGMSIAGSMMNGVLQSMNSSSDLLFKYQNMLKNEQARKFAQGMQIQGAIQDQYKTALQDQWKNRSFDIADERNNIAREKLNLDKKRNESNAQQKNLSNIYNRFNMLNNLLRSTKQYDYKLQSDGTYLPVETEEYKNIQNEMKEIANGIAPSAVAKTIAPPAGSIAAKPAAAAEPAGSAPSSLDASAKVPVTKPVGEDPELAYNDWSDAVSDLAKYNNNGALIPEAKITDPKKNLTYAKKIVNGIPEQSEAGNIQEFFRSGQNARNFIRILPPVPAVYAISSQKIPSCIY